MLVCVDVQRRQRTVLSGSQILLQSDSQCVSSVWEQFSWLGKQFFNQVKRGCGFFCVCLCVSVRVGWCYISWEHSCPATNPYQAPREVQGLSPNSLFFFVSPLPSPTNPSLPESSDTLFSSTLLYFFSSPITLLISIFSSYLHHFSFLLATSLLCSHHLF